MKKINFKKALMQTGGAMAGGVFIGTVQAKINEFFPENQQAAAIGTLAIAFLASQQKNELLSAAGLGAIGRVAPDVIQSFGIDLGITGPTMLAAPGGRRNLDNAKVIKMMEAMKDGRKAVAGSNPDSIYNAIRNAQAAN
jgi:hypothetical protein